MQNLTEKFVKEVEQRILTGQWEIGMKIPSSRALADEFFVSRSVINAGIAELCCNGYLTTVPKGSVYVADWRKMGNFALIGGLIDNDLVDLHAIDSLLEGRMAIYKIIVRKAAQMRTEEDLAQLRLIIDGEKDCPTPEEKTKADEAFRHAVAAASHNIVYTVMMNSFSAVTEKLTLRFYQKPINHDFVVQTHERILEALRKGDPDAAENAMEALLAHGEAELRR